MKNTTQGNIKTSIKPLLTFLYQRKYFYFIIWSILCKTIWHRNMCRPHCKNSKWGQRTLLVSL